MGSLGSVQDSCSGPLLAGFVLVEFGCSMGVGAPARQRNPLHPKGLGVQLLCFRTDAAFDIAPKRGYNVYMTTKDLIGDKIIDLGQELGRMGESLPDHEIKTELHDALQILCEQFIEEKYVDIDDLVDVRFTVSIESFWK